MTSKPFRMGAPHAIAIFVGALAIVLAVNTVFVTLALRSFPGEDAPKSYLQGLHYNDTLADRAGQRALGWTATAWLSGDPSDQLVQVRITDAQGAPLDGLSLTGTLRRPTVGKLDQALTFRAIGDGRYTARVSNLASGQWTLSVRAATPSAHFDIEKRLLWSAS